ncbi:MAG: hypothetical protein WB780_07745 [Candidatus Acidiferrales bacterium]
MSPRTIFLSRLLGLYFLLVGLAMLAHRQATVEIVTALVRNAPLMFIGGLIALVAGLAIVLSHNVWSGGILPVIITIIGWIMLLKGALILFLPHDAAAGFFLGSLHYENLFPLYAAFSLILGAYLTYGGFRSASR